MPMTHINRLVERANLSRMKTMKNCPVPHQRILMSNIVAVTQDNQTMLQLKVIRLKQLAIKHSRLKQIARLMLKSKRIYRPCQLIISSRR